MSRGRSKRRRQPDLHKRVPPAARDGKFFSPTAIDKRASQPYIPLFCPHCGTQSITTAEYVRHLDLKRHQKYINRNIENHEADLGQMRRKQKEAQNIADEADRLQGLSTDSKHCEICELDYHQEESKHTDSKLHKALQELLHRECKRCSYKSKSIRDYEIHLGSLEHVMKEEAERCKGRFENCDIEMIEMKATNNPGLEEGTSPKASSLTSQDQHKINSDIDKTAIQSTSNSVLEEGSSSKNSALRSPVKISDCVAVKGTLTEVSTLYCKVCQQYLNHRGNREVVAKEHCKSRKHLINWIKDAEQKCGQS